MGIGRKNRRVSIWKELSALIIGAMLISLIFFAALNRSGEYLIERKFEDEAYLEKKNQEEIDSLKSYIEENQLSVHDKDMLTKWVDAHSLVSIQIFRDRVLQYDSSYPGIEMESEANASDYYEWMKYYTVNFADGEADIFIVGFYSYAYRTWALIFEIILSFLLFILIVLIGIQKPIQYIQKLSEEICILEGGDLGYEISVRGYDELAELAAGLNKMRVSLKTQMDQEAKVLQSHQRLVTEMSHDLRTPLTSLLICTELLKQKKYRDENQLREYVEKIEKKAKQIKGMSDHLFEYSLIEFNRETELEDAEQFQILFYDLLSDISMYLEQRGIHTENCFADADTRIQINTDYVNRILDNIVSNLIKYTDRAAPVWIRVKKCGNHMELSFENRIGRESENVESTKIGLMNVRNMMENMKGHCRIEQTENTFCVTLCFPEQ